MTKENKTFSTFIGILVAGVVIALAMPILQLVLGFTSPTENPPGGNGALYADSGNIGVASGTRIIGVASPVDSNDVANKAYVDAAAGGGNTLVTLFGVSNANPLAGGGIVAAGGIPNCLRGYTGTGCVVTAGAAAGTGTPDCSTLGTGWDELYAGYGPMNTMFSWYNTNFTGSDLSWPPEDSTAPDGGIVIGTDSICSTASFANVDDVYYSQQNGQYSRGSSVLSACTGAGDCNTCRVCIKN